MEYNSRNVYIICIFWVFIHKLIKINRNKHYNTNQKFFNCTKMLRRNLIVAFIQNKTNSVALSELNHRIMLLNVRIRVYNKHKHWWFAENMNDITIFLNELQDNSNSCLNLTNNHVDIYCSWLPYGGQKIHDTEIGINASVAKMMGNSKISY